MKTKTKSILLIGGVFVLGIVVGFLIQHTLMMGQMKKFGMMTQKHGLEIIMKDLIRPTRDQEESIDGVLKKYSPIFSEMQARHMDEVKKNMDNFEKELLPLLNQNQSDRLLGMKKKMEFIENKLKKEPLKK